MTSMSGSDAKISISGEAGARSIALPGSWVAPEGLELDGTAFTLDYRGGKRVTFTLKR